MNRNILATALLTSLMLTACGGGGGGGSNVKPEAPPPTTPPTTPPPTTPPPTEPDPTPPPAPERTYEGLEDNTLFPVNADIVHAEGITGDGVKVGLLDDQYYEQYEPTEGKVAFYGDYTENEGVPESVDNTKRGHGTRIAAIIAGKTTDDWKGGVAPDASLYYGRVCAEDACNSSDAKLAIDALSGMGVRLFNLSFGSYDEDELAQRRSSAIYTSTLEAVIANDGLAMISTGNESAADTGFPAGAPVYQPILKDNIIAVTAVDVDAEGVASGLSDYANACGRAADWCVSAPGLHTTPFLDTWDSGYEHGTQGTSNANGVVTGVAALVQQAFPWMGGHNIQQTILTTATDLGDAGADAVFGWGVVNAEKAIMGPAQFFGDDFVADVTGSSVFGNDISGEFGLVKNGAGSLRLDGTGTFAGDTVINAGTLGFKGDTASNVIVNDGGTYAASGGVIGGDYSTSAQATTAIQLGVPLSITGSATLDGTLKLLPESGDYTVGGTENLLTAKAVGGTFSDVTYGNDFFWDATLNYTATGVNAALTRASAAASAMASGASLAVVDGAGQMDALVGALDQRVATGDTAGLESLLAGAGSIISAADPVTAAALESLTGQIHGVQRTVGVQTVVNESRLLADRLPHLANTFAPTAWVQAQYLDGALNRDGYADAGYRQNAVTIGIDVPLEGAVIGASLTSGGHKADVAASRSELDADRVGFSGYAYSSFGKAYLSGVAGYEWTDVDTRRDVITGETVEQVVGKRDEAAWHARIEAGVTVSNGMTPFAAVGTVHQEQEGFTEHGANGLGLSANSDSLSLTYADVGLRHRSYNGSWTFDSLLAYRDVFDADATSFDAWFTGLPDATFTVNGQPVPDSSVRVSFGASYALSAHLLMYGNVAIERSGDDHDNEGANLGLRWNF
ncbi:MAG: S8 family serine peptidase [Pseudomonas sp.]